MLSVLFIQLIWKLMFNKKKTPVVTSYTSNKVLKTIAKDWQGTPLDQDGLFINPEFPTILSFREIFKYLTTKNPQRSIKKHDPWHISVLKEDGWLNDPEDKIVWLGHASFFIQLAGLRILIDPMFGNLAVAKRHSQLPVDPKKLSNIDYILISHAHYDHCDKKSIKLLAENNPQAKILCGLNLDKLISKWVSNSVQTAGWYQQYETKGDLLITFVPSRHWANRSLFDINTTLWGGFVIQSGDKCIYFSGDSGYGSHFKEIGKYFSDIDVAMIGAGAYAPTWFMGQHHQDPYKALEAFHAVGAKTFIPFHYGTFDSADEPMGEPEQILTKLNAEGKISTLKILKLGEKFKI
ncbi:MAG TPA: MBL fold metallo-hydrolase [Cytophagaceae bacterium]|nr:MBL fold metallo-hydrolase [Cytophagaceae bacterium]